MTMSFKEYLQNEGTIGDALNLSGRIAYKYAGKIIKMTAHGIERVLERSKITKDQLATLFQRAIDKANELKPKLESEVLFYSRELKQGFVSAIDREGLRIITFLPAGKSIAKPGTSKLVVEGYDGESYTVEQIIEID